MKLTLSGHQQYWVLLVMLPTRKHPHVLYNVEWALSFKSPHLSHSSFHIDNNNTITHAYETLVL